MIVMPREPYQQADNQWAVHLGTGDVHRFEEEIEALRFYVQKTEEYVDYQHNALKIFHDFIFNGGFAYPVTYRSQEHDRT